MQFILFLYLVTCGHILWFDNAKIDKFLSNNANTYLQIALSRGSCKLPEYQGEVTNFAQLRDFGVIAIKAIQEQQILIDSQTVKTENLEKQNSVLEKRLSELERIILEK